MAWAGERPLDPRETDIDVRYVGATVGFGGAYMWKEGEVKHVV